MLKKYLKKISITRSNRPTPPLTRGYIYTQVVDQLYFNSLKRSPLDTTVVHVVKSFGDQLAGWFYRHCQRFHVLKYGFVSLWR